MLGTVHVSRVYTVCTYLLYFNGVSDLLLFTSILHKNYYTTTLATEYLSKHTHINNHYIIVETSSKLVHKIIANKRKIQKYAYENISIYPDLLRFLHHLSIISSDERMLLQFYGS